MAAASVGSASLAANHPEPKEAEKDLSYKPSWPEQQQAQRGCQKVAAKVRPKRRNPIRNGCQRNQASRLQKASTQLRKYLLQALLSWALLGSQGGFCQLAGVRGNWAAANGKSELSFDNQALKSIPSEQLCALTSDRLSQLNVASFAGNQIERLEPNAFACIGPMLKILILRYNEIELISDAAFAQLELVQVLVLDNNQLQAIPSKEALRPLKSLRHLSLANNRIEWLDEHAFGSHSASLISLNLKGNPLQRVAPTSLSSLAKLKTLTLSQSALSGEAPILFGLAELRFLHLDRAANLSSVGQDLCSGSRKLTALVLKSNQLERVPQFAHCQPLLQLDLSYNRIRGSLAQNFSQQTSLIDLYLGHNLLTSLHESAFAGLTSLQVLELSNNQLLSVHQRAFVPVSSTLYELSLSHNPNLRQLSSLGLERLISLKAFGNQQLRDLPYFESASSLALTYAYHCCDYLASSQSSLPPSVVDGELTRAGQQQVAPTTSAVLRAAFARIGRLFGAGGHDEAPEAPDKKLPLPGDQLRGLDSSLATMFKRDNGDDDVENLTDLVLWPASFGSSWPKRAPNRLLHSFSTDHSNQLRRRPQRTPGDDNQPEVGGAGAGEEQQQLKRHQHQHRLDGRQLARRTRSGRRLERPKPDNNKGSRVIDELLWQAKQIRRAHLVGPSFASAQAQDERAASSADSTQLAELIESALADDERRLQQQPSLSSEQEETTRARRGNSSSNSNNKDSSDEGRLDMNLRKALQVEWPRRQLQRRQLSGEQRATSQVREDSHNQDGDTSEQRTTTSIRKPAAAVQCLPQPNAFLPCRDLFDTWPLRAGIWFVFVVAFAGNILVILVLGFVRQSSSASALTSIMWLAHSKRHIDVPRFLVINLAVADLLMALYLGLLAAVDLGTLGQFKVFAIEWQYSTGCKLAGFLGVLSSELSVFILAIITLERNYAITNAVHLNRRLSLQKAMLIMLLGYALALSMALMPLNGISDYRKFSICLPLDVESSLASQVYVVTLVGINTFSFILLLSCYLRMYFAIRGSQAWNTNDLRIAKRMSILVATDFLCWVPIIVVASAALFGYHLVGTQGLKTLTIFVLPLNSIANPFLYAITTKKFKRDLDTLMRRVRVLAGPLSHYCCHPCCCCCQTNSKLHGKLAAHQQGTTNNNNNYYSSAAGKLQFHQHHYLHQNMAINGRRSAGGGGAGAKSHQQLAGGRNQDGRQRAGQFAQRAAQTEASRRNGAPSGLQCSSRLNQASTEHRAASCSCQRLQQFQEPDSNAAPERAQALPTQTSQQQRREQRQQFHLQPRIVLDGVEPAEWSQTCHEEDGGDNSVPSALIRKSLSATNSALLLATTEPANRAARKQVADRYIVGRLPSSSSSLHTDRGLDYHCNGADDDALTADNNGPLPTRSASTLPPSKASSSSQSSSSPSSSPASPPEAAGATPSTSARAERRLLVLTRPQADGRGEPAIALRPCFSARSAGPSCLGRSSSATVATAMAAAAVTVMASSCQAIIVDEVACAGACDCAQSKSANVNFNKQQKQSRRFLSVMAPTQMAVDLRPASVCGRYRSSRSDPSSGQEEEEEDNERGEGADRATARKAGANCRIVSGSCEAMKPLNNREAQRSRAHYQHHGRRHHHHQHEPLRSREKLSQSIGRLLFGPIAKAWSSIQISLNSSATHVGAERSSSASPNLDHNNCDSPAREGLLQQHQRRRRGRPHYVGSGPVDCDCYCADSFSGGAGSNKNRRKAAPATTTTTACDLLTKQNSTTVDDILLMSSPSKHFYKHGERRMSRSCDMIPQQYFLTSPTNSSGAAHDLTTTSTTATTTGHGDYDDDQRILLATINRMAGVSRRRANPKGGQQKQPLDIEGTNSNTNSNQYLRSKCARCRSWSPALLSKLEDCIYQIKSRIPRLNASQTDGDQAHETMQQIESSDGQLDDNHLRLSFDDSDGDEMNCEANAANCSGDCGILRDTNKIPGGGGYELTGGDREQTDLIAHSDDDEDDEDDDDDDEQEADYDDDKFNEGGLLEWSERRNAMVRRGHLLRKHSVKLQKQSSANSDTLSTRTAGTVVTTMSASFDSETGIPAPSSHQSQQPQQLVSQPQNSFVANLHSRNDV